MDDISIEDQIACVEREIGFRLKTYPRFVAKKQLTQKTADLELARMTAVKETLVGIGRGLVYCPRCECSRQVIDGGSTCGVCRLVLP